MEFHSTPFTLVAQPTLAVRWLSSKIRGILYSVLGWVRTFASPRARIMAREIRTCWKGYPKSRDLPRASYFSFLWKFKDNVRVYKWTGKNDYVALCEPEYLSFGGG